MRENQKSINKREIEKPQRSKERVRVKKLRKEKETDNVDKGRERGIETSRN